MSVKRLTTRGYQTAEAIRDRVPFSTSGALSGTKMPGMSTWSSGRLVGDDLERFKADAKDIDYVVFSYGTPIAWHTTDGRWHKVAQKFSVTTSRHQGLLYLID